MQLASPSKMTMSLSQFNLWACQDLGFKLKKLLNGFFVDDDALATTYCTMSLMTVTGSVVSSSPIVLLLHGDQETEKTFIGS